MLRVPLHRLDPELPVPAYARPGDAGADLLARSDVVLARGGGRGVVPTGVAVAIPDGYAGLRPAAQRAGGCATGSPASTRPGLVDSGYRGELQVVLVNHDPGEDYAVRRGDRIAQLVHRGGGAGGLRARGAEGLGESERGAGGFGHTGPMTAERADR